MSDLCSKCYTHTLQQIHFEYETPTAISNGSSSPFDFKSTSEQDYKSKSIHSYDSKLLKFVKAL